MPTPTTTTEPKVEPTPAPTTEPKVEPTPAPDDGRDRIKKDMLKFKDENNQLKKELDALKLKGHAEKEDWKTVAEHHEAKSKDFESKYVGLQGSLLNDKKISALTIEAQKQGINPASLPDLELLDFDEIQVETTSTGKILVSGQDRAIAKLKTMRPHWFSKNVPNVNPNTPNTERPKSGVTTLADVNLAEAQYLKTKSESDKKNYAETIQKYKTQNG